MTATLWLCTVPLLAEFVMAPLNLWSGRTMANFTAFTGYSPWVARRIFAPVKLLGAVLLAAGIALPLAQSIGAVLLLAISGVYLVLLASRGRREPWGVAAFTVTAALAAALLLLSLGR